MKACGIKRGESGASLIEDRESGRCTEGLVEKRRGKGGPGLGQCPGRVCVC